MKTNERHIDVPTRILIDKNLSLKARTLYCIIKLLLEEPNVHFTRDLAYKFSGVGNTSFKSTWNELKEKGYLLVIREGNKFRYELK